MAAPTGRATRGLHVSTFLHFLMKPTIEQFQEWKSQQVAWITSFQCYQAGYAEAVEQSRGPGTPAARFDYLVHELQKRFSLTPEEQASSTRSVEEVLLEKLDWALRLLSGTGQAHPEDSTAEQRRSGPRDWSDRELQEGDPIKLDRDMGQTKGWLEKGTKTRLDHSGWYIRKEDDQLEEVPQSGGCLLAWFDGQGRPRRSKERGHENQERRAPARVVLETKLLSVVSDKTDYTLQPYTAGNRILGIELAASAVDALGEENMKRLRQYAALGPNHNGCGGQVLSSVTVRRLEQVLVECPGIGDLEPIVSLRNDGVISLRIWPKKLIELVLDTERIRYRVYGVPSEGSMEYNELADRLKGWL